MVFSCIWFWVLLKDRCCFSNNSDGMKLLATNIEWPGGASAAPTGQPHCGWDNEFCASAGSSSVNLSLLRVCLSVSDTLTFLLHCGFSYSPLLCLIVSLLLSHISFLILPITYYVSLFLSKCFFYNLSQLSRWFAVDCFFACLLYVSLIIHDHSLEFVVGLCACSGWVIFLNDL